MMTDEQLLTTVELCTQLRVHHSPFRVAAQHEASRLEGRVLKEIRRRDESHRREGERKRNEEQAFKRPGGPVANVEWEPALPVVTEEAIPAAAQALFRYYRGTMQRYGAFHFQDQADTMVRIVLHALITGKAVTK
jgi:hypothetical protein